MEVWYKRKSMKTNKSKLQCIYSVKRDVLYVSNYRYVNVKNIIFFVKFISVSNDKSKVAIDVH